jgi:hypothetical protein
MVHPAHLRANVSMPAGLLARGSAWQAAFSPMRKAALAMADGLQLATYSCGSSYGFASVFPFQPFRVTFI